MLNQFSNDIRIFILCVPILSLTISFVRFVLDKRGLVGPLTSVDLHNFIVFEAHETLACLRLNPVDQSMSGAGGAARRARACCARNNELLLSWSVMIFSSALFSRDSGYFHFTALSGSTVSRDFAKPGISTVSQL